MGDAKRKVTKVVSEVGYLPPQNIDIERMVLGSCMIDAEAVPLVCGKIGTRSHVFYKESHGVIYNAILACHIKRRHPDIVTLAEELTVAGKLEQAGGAFEVAEMSNSTSSGAYIEQHLEILLSCFVDREAMKRSQADTVSFAQRPDDSAKAIAETIAYYGDLLQLQSPGEIYDLQSLVMSTINEVGVGMEARKRGEEYSVGHNTLLTSWDRVTGGLQPGENYIFAARPGMGKTALALTIAKNLATQGIPVGILSGEMTGQELVRRLLADASGVSTRDQKMAWLSDVEYTTLFNKGTDIAGLPIYIVDKNLHGSHQYQAKIAQMVAKHNVKVVIGDYIQLLAEYGSKIANREQKVSEMSQAGKNSAKDHGIAHIALSQLSRAVETRGGTKRPQLSDLRESGAIEQDADVITFIYRPLLL